MDAREIQLLNAAKNSAYHLLIPGTHLSRSDALKMSNPPAEAGCMQDKTLQQWPVDLAYLEPSCLCLMHGLSDFYERAAALQGDCLLVTSQSDGSVLLQVDSDHNSE